MPAYRFEAVGDDGQVEKGELDAESPRAARAQLRGRGLVAVSVEPLGATAGAAGTARRGRMGSAPLALATRQLASLLNAGLPLDVALSTLADQVDDRAHREIFRAVRSDVLAGHRLADALAQHPRAFPPIYCATVSAGEQAGSFGKVLERLAQYLEDRQALRAKLLAAALYPAIVTALALGIVLFLMTYVVPQVVQVFEHTRQVLPLPTRILMAVSRGLQGFGWLLLAGVIAGGIGARAALRRRGPKAAWDRFLLRLPVVGTLVRGVDTARFASTLATLTEAGVPMLSAITAASETLSNSVLRAAVDAVVVQVREGMGLGRALSQTRVFPPILVRLVELGESTGQLPDMLGHAARNQAREVEQRAGAAAAILEPALILAMGLVVMGIVMAVLMPIIEINQLVR